MKAVSSMATRGVLGALAEAAASAGLPRLEIESVGGVDAAARVAAGERFDLVFLAEGALRRLAADGHVRSGSVMPLMRSQTAVAVSAVGVDAAAAVRTPAFPDASAVRTALRSANRIGYSTGPSGTALVTLIEEWGMTAELDGRLVQARPGVPVAAALAAGEVDLGFQQLSELAGQPGIRILGVMPTDCAVDTVFAGAVGAAAADGVAAQRVLEFFGSTDAAAITADHCFLPAPRR